MSKTYSYNPKKWEKVVYCYNLQGKKHVSFTSKCPDDLIDLLIKPNKNKR